MISASVLISKILKASSLVDVTGSSDWKSSFKNILREVHPDVCDHPQATAAVARLNQLRTEFEKGKTFSDESGSFITTGFRTEYSGDPDLISASLFNYNLLKRTASSHLLKYMPVRMYREAEKVVAEYAERAVPLTGVQLPQEHVNWILSRLLEFSILIAEAGYTHAGISPASVFVVPETHGVIVTSFYHMTRIGRPVTTTNGHYQSWHPQILFDKKTAEPYVDIELSKKLAVCILGDPSGVGVKLRKTHHTSVIDFLLASDTDPLKTYQRYRTLLKRNFKTAFHILHL